MRAKFLLFLLFFLFVGTAAAEAAAPFRVTLLLGGAADDQGFNQLCAEGLENARKRYHARLSAKTILWREAEPRGEGFFDQTAQESDLVIVADDRYLEALRSAAPRFSQVKFAVIDGSGGIPNVKDVVFREEEGGFLAGVLAGLLTNRAGFDRINPGGAVGVLTGAEIPATRRFAQGFKAGVYYADDNIKVHEAAVGNFQDMSAARGLALSMRNDGADIIFVAAGKAGLGAIDSAASGGYWVIGADSAQELVEPDAVLVSVVKNSGVAVFQLIESCMKDKWDPGTLSLGVREDGIALSTWTRPAKTRIPVDIRNQLDEVEDKFRNDLIKIQ